MEQVVESRPSSNAGRVEPEIELDHGGGRMARIGMGRRRHPCQGCIRRITKDGCSGSEEVSELRRASQRSHQPTKQPEPRAPSTDAGSGDADEHCSTQTGIRLKRPNRWKQGIITNKTSYHQATWQPRAFSARSSRVRGRCTPLM